MYTVLYTGFFYQCPHVSVHYSKNIYATFTNFDTLSRLFSKTQLSMSSQSIPVRAQKWPHFCTHLDDLSKIVCKNINNYIFLDDLTHTYISLAFYCISKVENRNNVKKIIYRMLIPLEYYKKYKIYTRIVAWNTTPKDMPTHNVKVFKNNFQKNLINATYNKN